MAKVNIFCIGNDHWHTYHIFTNNCANWVKAWCCFMWLKKSAITFVKGCKWLKLVYIMQTYMYNEFTWWRHQMETFSALLAICAGNSPVTGEFLNKGQWRGALMFSLICARINGCVNNREAGDLWRHRAHYFATVILFPDDIAQLAMIHVYFIRVTSHAK